MQDQVAFDIAGEDFAIGIGLMFRTLDTSSEAIHFQRDQHSHNHGAVASLFSEAAESNRNMIVDEACKSGIKHKPLERITTGNRR
jgi:hypothetical protein